MGGGLAWRCISKVISPTLGLGSIVPSSSAGPSSVRVASASMMHASSAVATPSLRLAAADDWELAGGEEEHRGSIRDKLMFGTQPSLDEVSEATTELRNALGPCVEDECTCTPEGFAPPATSSPRSERTGSRFGHAADWMEPHLVSYSPGTVQVRRSSEVADAFRLLQTDSAVQGVVMSIASDKAVWEALLNNEKVKEFRKNLQTYEAGEESSKDYRTGENVFDRVKSLFNNFMGSSKRVCSQLKSMLDDMVTGLVNVFEKTLFGDKNGDFADKALKSCFMLSVMVLSIVLLKRAAI